ncbi:AMP-binding protein [Lacisediminihabitans profunda]|uniref:AMP-binding protein n=1 Tax=Lacisediminihabitans profunda TaxID=2594790 RepID=UPI001FE40E8B|nr:AMP-binding protein [Lacisediminihabitans profunda]
MSRPLRVVPADDAAVVLEALRDALAGGPAVLPGAPSSGLPATVEQRVALVVETSGSTGAPKRVALAANAILASAAASEAALGGPGQWLLALPAHYIAGINVLVRSIAAQTQPVIMPSGHFDAVAFAAASGRLDGELRFTSLVPAQLARLVEAAEDDLGVLEALRRFDRMLVGGQATPPQLVGRALELGFNVTRTYGSSETSGGCVYDGVPIGTAQARIENGQVELAGPMLAEGYLGDPERTAAAFCEADGIRWYRTGDTGEIVDGVLTVTGRIDGILISGGVKVSLEAIERVVRGLDGLADAVAVRAPSVTWGEVPVVFSTGALPLAELRSIVSGTLGAASAPAAIVRVEAIPLLSSGKPDRVVLAELAAASAGVDVGRQ